MESIIKITEFQKNIEKETVLKLMDCKEDSPIYEEVQKEFAELKHEVERRLEPGALIGFGKVTGELACDKLKADEEVIYVLATVGKEVSRYSSEFFEEGDFLKGMLADAMADACLFAMDHEIEAVLKEECARRKIGIVSRLEAPNDIPMNAQKIAFDVLEADERLGIAISPSYMYDPVKTSCQVMQITDDASVFRAQHNCRKCSAKNCSMRKIQPVTITVKNKDKEIVVVSEEYENILAAINRQGAYFSAVCGGKGNCGKCKIRLVEGELDITPSDRKHFTEEELELGYRLACRAYPAEDCVITMDVQDEEGFSIQIGHGEDQQEHAAVDEAGYDIAVDIGTTTLAFQLVGKTGKKAVGSFATLNRQRAFGADVISRIQASCDGKKDALRRSIQEDLMTGIKALVKNAGIGPDQIDRIAIGGNTTMGHLLMGYSCEGLGLFPFTPVDISLIERPFHEVLENDYCKAEVILLPGISTYVGGDIVSGLYDCEFDTNEKTALLVDLGTNGEMAIGNRDRIVSTSTAAGPAFEGGNISWGMGSVQGAICKVEIEDGRANVATIGDKMPVGLCGTGVIETISELIEHELVDETGRLEEEYFEKGYFLAKTADGRDITFTQQDVREIQLAKSAVRAGIEVLLRRFGVTYDQVDAVYLAGGFGYHINQEKAMVLGLIPREFDGKIKAVGNSSLGGALRYLINDDSKEKLEMILEHSSEIDLSTDADFNDLYMEHMFFE
ncbi:ASKHA domain-containing protein [Ruminococcus sp. OA3]|uniref:ASKHA domain-containing protein n=1 Tax=Ruminococcus sp. OA3 TaxID=2914164 RepID=UPI001F05AB88|nr:ASKHA domain-containing protein [Ruminococcus sp. OA3]MCH1984207.1 ASKHA domain-containing protein [Ruminococcus sp. OA3]